MRIPVAERVTAVALVGVTASGKSDAALAVALRRRGDCEIVSVDSMCVYRGMDIGTSKPGPEARAAVPHHLLDLVDPDADFTVSEFQLAARTALAGIEARGHHALLVGGTGLYLRAVVDDLSIPGRYPEVAAALEAELDDGRADPVDLHARLARLDPVGAGRMEPTNRRRVVRALEVTIGAGRPFSEFGPGLEAYAATACGRSVWSGRPTRSTGASRRASRPWSTPASSTRCASWPPVRRASRARHARRSGIERSWPTSKEGVPLDECLAEAVRRTRQFARRQASWFRRDPRIAWAAGGAEAEALLEGAIGPHG